VAEERKPLMGAREVDLTEEEEEVLHLLRRSTIRLHPTSVQSQTKVIIKALKMWFTTSGGP